MDIKSIVFWLCVVAFALPALYFGFSKVKQDAQKVADFTRWGYSKSFMIALGFAEMLAGMGLFFPTTRMISMGVYAVILFGAIFTHLKYDTMKEVTAPVCVMGLLIAIYFLQ